MEVKKLGSVYDLALEIGLGANYPWRNLYLMAIWEQPDGYRQASRLQLVFQDEAGEWYARGGRFHTFLARDMRVGSPGLYRISVLPYIRADSVPGIRFLRIRMYARE